MENRRRYLRTPDIKKIQNPGEFQVKIKKKAPLTVNPVAFRDTGEIGKARVRSVNRVRPLPGRDKKSGRDQTVTQETTGEQVASLWMH